MASLALGALLAAPATWGTPVSEESPVFAVDLTIGPGAASGPRSALGLVFPVDLRGVTGPSDLVRAGESATFAVNLRGFAGGLVVSGNVRDGVTGLPLPGVTVQVGSSNTTTDGSGQYALPNVAQGVYTLRATKTGYLPYEGQVNVQSGSSVVRPIALMAAASPEIRVTAVSSKYAGFQHFLQGGKRTAVPPVDFSVTFVANASWGSHPEGTVRFVTPKKTYTATASGGVASQAIDMTADLDWKDRLQVVAVSSDGNQSSPKLTDFVVMKNPWGPLQGIMAISDQGASFEYNSSARIETSFLDAGIGAGVIPENFPLVGGKSIVLQFIPSVGATVGSDGKATISLKWENIEAMSALDREWGRNHDARKMGALISDFLAKGVLDRRRLPKAGIAGAEIYFYPSYKHSLQHNDLNYEWDWASSSLEIAGYGKVEKSWPFVLMAGPIPVPMYAKAKIEAEVSLAGRMTATNPAVPDVVIGFEPYARGSLGVGVDDVLAVEGWIGGGVDMTVQYPSEPHLADATIYLNGGVKVVALLWSWKTELMRWDWPDDEGGAMLLSVRPSPAGEPLSRSYLTAPNYGFFAGGQSGAGGLPAIKPPGLRPEIRPLQTQVFPYSEPELASSGTNVLLAWLYDEPARSTNNRTVVSSSWFGGTNWSSPTTVEDDGTADFHPSLVVFGPKSAAAAWEDGGAVLSDAADFEAMKTNLEISVALHSPVSNLWLAARRFTTNNYLDRSPILAGRATNNVILAWIANTNSHLTGNSTNANWVMFTRWNGTNWSAPAAIATSAYPSLKYDLAYNGTNAWLVMTLDLDQDTGTLGDRELFRMTYSGTNWSAMDRLTTDDVVDDNAQLALDPAGNVVMVWVKTNEVLSAVNFDLANRQVLRTDGEYSSNLADFRLGSSPDGRMAVVWAEPIDYSSDLRAMFYDPVFQMWGQAKALTSDPETERGTTVAFYGADTLMTVYDRTEVGQTNGPASLASGKVLTIPVFGATDLYYLKYRLGGDLSLDTNSLHGTPPNPAPGSQAEMEFNVVNLGDGVVSNAVVAFYLGVPGAGGVEIGRTNVLGPIVPGASIRGVFVWTVLANARSAALYAVVDPDQNLTDADRLNNVAGDVFVAPDLAVQSLTWSRITPTLLSVSVRIGNQGVVRSMAATVQFSLGSASGSVLHGTSVGGLEPGQSADVAFDWDISGLAADSQLWAVVDPAQALDDFDRDNNAAVLSVSRVMVTGQPVLGPTAAVTNAVYSFSVETEIGRDCVIESSTNMVDWTPVRSFVSTNAIMSVSEPVGTNDVRHYYRATVP